MRKFLGAIAASAFGLMAFAAQASTVILLPEESVSFAETQTDFDLPGAFQKYNPADYGGRALNSVHVFLEATVNAVPTVMCITPGQNGKCEGTLGGVLTATLSSFGADNLVTTVPISAFAYSQGAGTVTYATQTATNSNSVVYCVNNVAGCNVIDAAIVALFSGIGPIAVNLSGDGVTNATQTNGFALTGQPLTGSAVARIAYDYIEPAIIPVPAALPMLAGALGLLGWAGRRRKSA